MYVELRFGLSFLFSFGMVALATIKALLVSTKLKFEHIYVVDFLIALGAFMYSVRVVVADDHGSSMALLFIASSVPFGALVGLVVYTLVRHAITNSDLQSQLHDDKAIV